jgi:hypothetical protein
MNIAQDVEYEVKDLLNLDSAKAALRTQISKEAAEKKCREFLKNAKRANILDLCQQGEFHLPKFF